MDKSRWVDENKVYVIKRPNSKIYEIILYADAAYRGFEGICYVTAGDRGHMIDGQMGDKTETGFTFYPEVKKGEEPWEFEELTYQNFKEVYYKHVIAGQKVLDAVSSTEELVEWYHKCQTAD